MGNESSTSASAPERASTPRGSGLQKQRWLECTFRQPDLDPLLAGCPKPRATFAQVTSSPSGQVIDVQWGQPVQLKMVSEDETFTISVYGADSAEAFLRGERQLLCENRFPSQGSGSLSDLGVSPSSASIPVSRGPNVAQIGVSARAVDSMQGQHGGSRSDGAGYGMPLPSRQLIALELENAALRKKAGIQEDPSQSAPKTMQVSAALDQENLDLQNQILAIQAQVDRTKGARPEAAPDLGRSYNAFANQIEASQKRTAEIRRNHEERVRAVQTQLQQFRYENDCLEAQSQATGPADGSHSLQRQVMDTNKRVEDMKLTRDKLLQQLRDMKSMQGDAGQGEDKNADIQKFRAIIAAEEAELESLKKELQAKNALKFGSVKCQELNTEVNRLRDELEEQMQLLNDERVRTESEVQELKIEVSRIKDLADNEKTGLQFLREKVKALRGVQVSPSPNQPSDVDHVRLRQEALESQQELDTLKKTVEDRMQTIQTLNKELEQLEEEARQAFFTSKSAPQTQAEAGSGIDIAAQLKALEEERQLLDEQEARLS